MRRTVEPKQERSTATRERVLAATLVCLDKLGYAGTTTLAVEKRAKVSRGALLYHFPTRAQLVAAAVEQLFRDLREEYGKAFAAIESSSDRVSAAVDLLWETYQDIRLVVVLELYLAARTDADLRATLQPVGDAHHQNVLRLAREFFPEAAGSARFEGAIQLVLDTLQGMATRRLMRPADPSISRTLVLLKQFAASAAFQE